jgi:penicillin-binding protein 1A
MGFFTQSKARKRGGSDRPRGNLDVRLSARDRTTPAESPVGRGIADAPARHNPKARPGRKARAGRGRSGLARAAYWGFVLCLWAVIAGIGAVAWIGAHLPAIQSLEVPKRPPSIRIAGLDGRVLATRGDSGVAASLKELPKYVPQAFIAIEDRRFYDHHGVDPMGVGRAMVANVLRRGVSQGGSTLTQQLAKNLFLTQERTYTRKIQELVLALWLERKFSKNEILELYLNRIYFGAGAYGIEAAAQRYFGKPAKQVTLAEAAMMAGLVKSPSRLAPTRNPDGAERRAQVVLTAMSSHGFVSESKAKIAIAQPAHALKQFQNGSVNYVADWIMDVLHDLVGRVEDDIIVETSIDPTLQAIAEKALTEELAVKGDKAGVGQGAMVAMSPDGAVRVLIGGRNYADSQFNRAVSAKRQPGSAFKPFVYLTAIERGLTPDTVREDKPISVKGWKPENYTREYFGPVTLTQAMAMSLNTVSVRLVLEFGPTAVTRTAYRLGISSRLEPNPSIALGTSEVSLIEMVSAFAPFANGGASIIPHAVENVRRPDGFVLYQRTPQNLGLVVEPRYVGTMNAMMQETLLTGTGRKAELSGYPAAGKTGTSQDFRDCWFVGYTAHLVTGVWLGNDDSSPTKKMTGGGLPAEIWARFMKAAHRGVAVANLPGLSGGSFFQTSGFNPPQPPSPTLAAAERPQPAGKRGIDNWLIDGLFGRR